MPTDFAFAINKVSMPERHKTADRSMVLACPILALFNVALMFVSPALVQAVAWSGQF